MPQIDLVNQQYQSAEANIDSTRKGISLGGETPVADSFLSKYSYQTHESTTPYYKAKTSEFEIGYEATDGSPIIKTNTLNLEISSAGVLMLDGVAVGVLINFNNQDKPVTIYGSTISSIAIDDYNISSTSGAITINTTGVAKDINFSSLGAGSNINFTAVDGFIHHSGGQYVDNTKIDDTDSPYTIADIDYLVFGDSTSGNIAITIPDGAEKDGRILKIKNTGTGTITITPAVGTIETAANLVLATLEVADIVSDGTNWWKL